MWKEGALKVHDSIFHFWVKYFEEPSQYGIDEGRISKLCLKRKDAIVCSYDRGWNIKPSDEDTEIALAIMEKEYNN